MYHVDHRKTQTQIIKKEVKSIYLRTESTPSSSSSVSLFAPLLLLLRIVFFGEPQISDEFRVHAFESNLFGHVGLLDTITVSFPVLIMIRVILALGHGG